MSTMSDTRAGRRADILAPLWLYRFGFDDDEGYTAEGLVGADAIRYGRVIGDLHTEGLIEQVGVREVRSEYGRGFIRGMKTWRATEKALPWLLANCPAFAREYEGVN